jgi:hypothetical protein
MEGARSTRVSCRRKTLLEQRRQRSHRTLAAFRQGHVELPQRFIVRPPHQSIIQGREVLSSAGGDKLDDLVLQKPFVQRVGRV